MSTKWPEVRLGEVVREEHDLVGSFDGDGLPVFGVTNINGVTQTGVEASDDRSKYVRLRPGRFVYNPYRVNVGSLGLSSETQDGIASPAYVVFIQTERIDANYLHYFLKSSRGNQLINFYGNRGTVRSALRFKDLCQIEIPLPPVTEQRRIVAKIDEMAAKIEEAQRLRRQTVEQTQVFITNLHIQLAGNRSRKLGDILKLYEDEVQVLPVDSIRRLG
jgi:type I restriction enzyme, S subunit